MLDTYFPVLAVILLASVVVLGMLGAAIFLGPKKYSEIKDEPFECGTVGSGHLGGRYSVKFYLVAMSFIVFDVEMVFFYPWAVNLKEQGVFGVLVIAPFFLILCVGLLYEWRRGVLDVV